MRNQKLTIISATAVSGAASGLLLSTDLTTSLGLTYGPGLCFGLVTAWLCMKLKRATLLKAAIWVAASIISWRLALAVYLMITDAEVTLVALALAGVTGGLLLGLGAWLLKFLPEPTHIIELAISGSVLGAAMYLLFMTDSFPTVTLMLNFALWQIGMGLMLFRGSPAKPRRA